MCPGGGTLPGSNREGDVPRLGPATPAPPGGGAPRPALSLFSMVLMRVDNSVTAARSSAKPGALASVDCTTLGLAAADFGRAVDGPSVMALAAFAARLPPGAPDMRSALAAAGVFLRALAEGGTSASLSSAKSISPVEW
eukprot:4842953-Amphidinium_carterae.6